MGLPYSRQINAAFEEVTPLVAAGFKVLQTTRNISIILAVVQILTVFLLFLILLALFALLYSVNPDLEHERTYMVTPILHSIAHITIWGVIRSVITTGAVLCATGYAIWKLFLAKQWVEDVEYEGNVDADKALEDLNQEDNGEGKKKKEEKKGKEGKQEKK